VENFPNSNAFLLSDSTGNKENRSRDLRLFDFAGQVEKKESCINKDAQI
jgi:hypothetical protein